MLAASVEEPGSWVNDFDLQIIQSRFWFVDQFLFDCDVVEFGAATTLGKNAILSKARTYCGIEIVPENAQKLENFLGNRGTVLNEDCCFTSLDDESCDIVLALAMVYYVDLDLMLEEAQRILRPGGRLLFCSPNSKQPFFRPAPGSKAYHSTEEVLQRAQDAGFLAQVHCAYKFSNLSSTKMGLLKNKLSVMFRKISPFLTTRYPILYKFIKQSTRGKMKKIPGTIDFDAAFEKPRPANCCSPLNYRMFYYDLRKP